MIARTAPSDFGLPKRFDRWRGGQWDAAMSILDSPRRFVVLTAPTGFGKSLVYVAASQISGGRAVALTSTKGLQSQLMGDFEEIGLVDVRGMSNYECPEIDQREARRGCDEGPCHAGYRCLRKSGGCPYFDAWRRGQQERLVVTNYAKWMTQNRYGGGGGEEGWGQVDLLILDEAHDAPDELASFLQIKMEQWEVEGVLGTRWLAEGASMEEWKDWAGFHGARVKDRLLGIKQRIMEASAGGMGEEGRRAAGKAGWEARSLREVGKKLEAIAGLKGEWVGERQGKAMVWDPVWPGEYAERWLFRGIEKVVLVSATVRGKTLDLLKVGAEEREEREWPSSFLVERRPVIHVPTVRMRHGMSESETRTWLTRIDQLIGPRLDRKGIIHTVSYRRRNQILQHSRYRDVMISHESGGASAKQALERFKRVAAPAILVSPSMGTGLDFPGDECRWQIVGKIPFPDTSGKVNEARRERDKDYGPYVAAQNLVQMAGRPVRSEKDWAETLIIDDMFTWFARKYRGFMPGWFNEAIRWARTCPEPLRIRG